MEGSNHHAGVGGQAKYAIILPVWADSMIFKLCFYFIIVRVEHLISPPVNLFAGYFSRYLIDGCSEVKAQLL